MHTSCYLRVDQSLLRFTDTLAGGAGTTPIRQPRQAGHLDVQSYRLQTVQGRWLACSEPACRELTSADQLSTLQMFARKYQRVASTYKDCVFLEVTGDETTNLRVSLSTTPSIGPPARLSRRYRYGIHAYSRSSNISLVPAEAHDSDGS